MPDSIPTIDATISYVMLEQCIAAALEALEEDNLQEAASELNEATLHLESLRPLIKKE